jgi:rhamnosyl/mannosyltransferase
VSAGILYLSPVAHAGGAELSLLDLAARLDRARFTPHVTCLGDGPLLALAARAGVPADGVPIPRALERTSLRGRRSGVLRLGRALAGALPVVAALRARMRTLRPAIVHSNGNKTHVLTLLGIAPRDAALIWHVHDFLPDRAFERWLIRAGNRRCDAIVANSAAVGRHLERLGARADRLHVITAAIDVTRFSPDGPAADLRGEFGWPASAGVVGMVGMLARWKGQGQLLDAIRRVRERRDVRAVVVGEEMYTTDGHGGFAAELRRRVRELGLEDAVAFAGRRDDVPAVMRGLDLVVHASIEPEPFGRVVAEAMACGRRLVAARGGGVDEIVAGAAGDHVRTVDAADSAALAETIATLLDHAPDEAAVARNRARVAERFDIAGHVRAFEALYSALCRAPRPAILHIGKFYPPARGGMEDVVARLAAGMAGRCRVRALVANERQRTEREMIDGVEVIRVARRAQAGALAICPGLVWRLWTARDDCIVLHEPNPLPMLGLALAWPRRPVIVWHHADFLRPRWARGLYRRLRTRIVRRAACVIVSNPVIAGAPYLRAARRIEVIPYGVSLERFVTPGPSVVARARELRAAFGPSVVLFVGRLVYYKGVDVLLHALRRCGATAVIVGDGRDGPELRALAARLGIAERVRFVADVTPEALPAYYHAADVFTLPSTHSTEAFGIVQVEAMASGLPVVSTNLESGVPWVNQHEVTGLVVPPGDADALGAALARLLADPAARARLGAAGRRRARETFTDEAMVARFAAVVDEACR